MPKTWFHLHTHAIEGHATADLKYATATVEWQPLTFPVAKRLSLIIQGPSLPENQAYDLVGSRLGN